LSLLSIGGGGARQAGQSRRGRHGAAEEVRGRPRWRDPRQWLPWPAAAELSARGHGGRRPLSLHEACGGHGGVPPTARERSIGGRPNNTVVGTCARAVAWRAHEEGDALGF
jgi:hypothetical protein